MPIGERWTENSGVRLHFLDGNDTIDTNLSPLFHIPGAFGSAESFVGEIPLLAPRRVISMSQRGRGKSDAPISGYTLDHLVGDVEAVVTEADLNSFFLYAFSLGVPPAIGYAIRHPERLKGLIIGDYPAQYPELPPAWADKFMQFPNDVVNHQAVCGTQQESKEVPMWDSLYKIQCPVLILCGDKKDADPKPVLKEEEIEMYKKYIPQASIVTFEQTGHRLWEHDYDGYIRTIRDFLSTNE